MSRQAEGDRGAVVALIEAAVSSQTLTVVTYSTLKRLAAELETDTNGAVRHIYDLAERYGRPIGVNYPTGKNTTRTAVIPPPGWSTERLSGYVAGQHEQLTALFGAVAKVTSGTGLV